MSQAGGGGPAFPDEGQADYTGGMTLRDYFAAKAMASYLVRPNLVVPKNASFEVAIAHWAYLQADAMLKEREERQP